jgi:nitroreductase
MYTLQPSQLIRQRYSCRTCQTRPISDQDLRSLVNFSQQVQVGPRGNPTRFRILPASPYDHQDLPRLGTYGFIKDPAAFIVGSIFDQPGALEDFGFNMELLILKATELKIGSCWLGGTFTKSRFSSLIDLQPGESIPAVTSLGYPSDHRAWVDRVARIYAGADRRLPWEELFFTNSWQDTLDSDQAGDFREPLQTVRLAPSASNKQPWRLLRDEDQWHFYLERTPNYPSRIFGPLLKIADLQRIDIGIAMAHFALSLEEIGLKGKWRVADPGLDRPGHAVEYIITWQAQERVK